MGLVVLLACSFALTVVIQGVLQVPIQGSIALFLAGAGLHLFATTSMGIFLATVAKSMPQFGLLLLLILLPMQILSGNATPRESMPPFIRTLMLASPTTHFVSLSQAILFRGADLTIVYHQFLNLVFIGGVFFTIAVIRFRKTISQMV
jgi:ABC-2 type transport system permease protein